MVSHNLTITTDLGLSGKIKTKFLLEQPSKPPNRALSAAFR